MTDSITSALKATVSPLPIPRTDLEITGITFDEGKLWKPRYGSLFAYAPEIEAFQLEPALQIIAPAGDLEIEVLFEIHADQAVRFLEDEEKPGSVRCRAIGDPKNANVAGLLSAAFEGERRCRLRWNRSALEKKVTTVRIFCQGEAGIPEDPKTLVEGGLYLSLINSPKNADIFQAASKESPRKDSTIKAIGVDKHGRPVYDLFLPASEDVPETLELEPALRCREGDEHHFKVELDLPDPYHVLVFETEGPGKVRVFPEQPPKLTRADTLPGNRICVLTWKQGKDRFLCKTGDPISTTPHCAQGATASFFFKTKIETGSKAPGLVRRLSEVLDIDPTVIQPPVCYDGVCIPPPNVLDSGARG